MNTIEEFYNDLMQQIYASADAGEDYKVSQFFDNAMSYLMEDGTVQDYTYLPYKKTGSGMRVDGYELIEDREILNLFICDYEESDSPITLTKTDIDKNVKRVIKFFIQSVEKELYRDLEETRPGFVMSRFLYENQNRFHAVNIVLVSNKLLSGRVKELPSERLEGYSVTYDIWDIGRFYEIETSKNKKETLVIDLVNDFDATIPSLPAHISASPYPSYLSVVSGDLLSKLYETYGSRLLESNVRSFLQFRAKINKGIRKTINEEPEMFFAYNNGITATAEEVELNEKNEKNEIVKIKNFQIVNGGQTTASLFNTKKADKVNLSDIFVQMKLTVINDEKVNDIVPNIAKYANTQNKVSDADFFSNDIYHIRMEEKSRRIWAPAKEGELKGTKWFYERARGQYLEVQSKLTDAKKREFKTIHPKSQMFTKTDLAKYLMVWENKPQIVSRGAQKNFKAFGEIIVPRWNKNDKEFNDLYFMHTVAKIIIFKACDYMVYREPWYGGYKANIVAYTLSTLSYLLEKEKKSIDFSAIWKIQEIPTYFLRELQNISEFINSYIVDTPENFTNVSEWCKKDICWTKLKEILDSGEQLILSEEFLEYMVTLEEVKYEGKEAKKEQQIDNTMELLKKMFKLPMDTWTEMVQWGQEKNILSQMQIDFLNLIPSGKYPSDKQSKKILETIMYLEDEGMKSIW
ncbi:MAG: AIPR family protein [Sulfurovum sp.]|nr:AIPR family protein [Sulfurovum sp.]